MSRTAAAACVAALIVMSSVGNAAEPPTTGGPATFRRLNERQYVRSIEDIFGKGLKIPGRFEPPLRDEGLLAIGDGKVTVSPSGVAATP
jgi:hypothetical protein